MRSGRPGRGQRCALWWVAAGSLLGCSSAEGAGPIRMAPEGTDGGTPLPSSVNQGGVGGDASGVNPEGAGGVTNVGGQGGVDTGRAGAPGGGASGSGGNAGGPSGAGSVGAPVGSVDGGGASSGGGPGAPMLGIGGSGQGGTGVGPSTGGFPPIDPVDVEVEARLDLLLVIDNSRSMDTAQQVFLDSLPQLVSGLARVSDVHLAVISSSLGNHGLDDDTICPALPHDDDRAHLIALARADAVLQADSYQGLGFLVWDPEAAAEPPGELDLDAFAGRLRRQLAAVGSTGCGFEAPLESAYRFLVDPEPPASIVRVPCTASSSSLSCAGPEGIDEALLVQRATFLRADSTLAIIVLTNENDCSLEDSGQGFFVMQPHDSMPRGTSQCEVDPNDPCCRSCAAAAPPECDAEASGCEGMVDPLEATPQQQIEAFNVRCFDHERRFGIDFLYPVTRYVSGFSNLQVPGRSGDLVPNPLFAGGRPPEQVFVAAIVGTPWQDVVIDLDDPDGEIANGADLDWSRFLAPAGSSFPSDPFNIEAMGVRSGTHPLTGDVLAGPGTLNAINGHDRNIVSGDGLTDDLQFACTFPLAEPKDCASLGVLACECTRNPSPADSSETEDYASDNPLCRAPDGSYGTDQYFGHGYPAPRLFQLVRDMGERGVLGSICPRPSVDPARPDFGYAPVFRALFRAMGMQ